MSLFFKRLSGYIDRKITIVGTGPMADAIEAFASDAQGTLEGEGQNAPQLPYVSEMAELSGSMDRCTGEAFKHASKGEQWKSASEAQKLTLIGASQVLVLEQKAQERASLPSEKAVEVWVSGVTRKVGANKQSAKSRTQPKADMKASAAGSTRP